MAQKHNQLPQDFVSANCFFVLGPQLKEIRMTRAQLGFYPAQMLHV